MWVEMRSTRNSPPCCFSPGFNDTLATCYAVAHVRRLKWETTLTGSLVNRRNAAAETPANNRREPIWHAITAAGQSDGIAQPPATRGSNSVCVHTIEGVISGRCGLANNTDMARQRVTHRLVGHRSSGHNSWGRVDRPAQPSGDLGLIGGFDEAYRAVVGSRNTHALSIAE